MEDSSGPWGAKRRASKACLRCRARKVRCDVKDGLPCTNCRLDSAECKVVESLRQRKRRANAPSTRRMTPEPSVEGDLSPTQYANLDNMTGLQRAPSIPNPNETASMHDPLTGWRDSERSRDLGTSALYSSLGRPRESTFVSNSDISPRLSQLSRVDTRESNRDAMSVGTRSNAQNHLPPSPPSQSSSSAGLGQETSAGPDPIALPGFIRKIPTRLGADDVEYLRKKGAFIVPDTTLRNELLRCYVEFVHPFLPILDLQDFLEALEKTVSTKTVSLLLFQAVMFAATPYVSLRLLAAHGYNNRRMARRAFYLRVKLLCDMDYEIDRVTVIQSTLLMTYWNETPDDPKDVWYWLGVAVSLSKAIGLNYDPSPFPPRDLQKRRLWKRIWWSCYMRDRLASLAFRRPARINHEQFDQPMLELSDFETKPLSSEVSKMLGPKCPSIADEAVRVSLAKLCIGMAKLCVCLTPILEMQCRAPKASPAQTTTPSASASSIPDPCDLLHCDRDLQTWYQTHAEEMCFPDGSASGNSAQRNCDVLDLHKAVLKGLYLTSISTLHRPQILSGAANSTLDPEIRDLSRRKTRNAAQDLTVLYTNLNAHALVRFLPNTGVTCLLHAAIVHILDQTSDDPDLKQTSMRKFNLCMQVLEQLGEMYASAAFACSFLTAAANKVSSRPETTEVMVGLSERMSNVQPSDDRACLQFEYQFNVPPSASASASIQAGGPGGIRQPPTTMAVAEPSRAPSRMELREMSDPSVDAAGVLSNQQNTSISTGTSIWRQQRSGADRIFLVNDKDADNLNDSRDEMQLDVDSFFDMEGCADFYKLSDELGVDFDKQWLDAFDLQGTRYPWPSSGWPNTT